MEGHFRRKVPVNAAAVDDLSGTQSATVISDIPAEHEDQRRNRKKLRKTQSNLSLKMLQAPLTMRLINAAAKLD